MRRLSHEPGAMSYAQLVTRGDRLLFDYHAPAADLRAANKSAVDGDELRDGDDGDDER